MVVLCTAAEISAESASLVFKRFAICKSSLFACTPPGLLEPPILPGITKKWVRKEGEVYNNEEAVPDSFIVIDNSPSMFMPNGNEVIAPSERTYQHIVGATAISNAYLANGLGNLVSRVARLCEKSEFRFQSKETKLYPEVSKAIEEFRFDTALKFIWEKITIIDQNINKSEPWKLEGEELKDKLQYYLEEIAEITLNLKPFLPETVGKIAKMFSSPVIRMGEPLFPRLK